MALQRSHFAPQKRRAYLFRSLALVFPLADDLKASTTNELFQLLCDCSAPERLYATPRKPLRRDTRQPSERFGARIAHELEQTGRLANSGPASDVMNPGPSTGSLTRAG